MRSVSLVTSERQGRKAAGMPKPHSRPVSSVIVALTAVAALAFSAGCSPSQPLKDPTRQPQGIIPAAKSLTAKDILNADLPWGPFMSPDASRAMWIKTNYTPGEELPSWKMYVTDLATLKSKLVLSGSGLIAGLPKWSPDGTTFAYIDAAPDGTTQLFTVPASGGKPTKVTSVEGGVVAHAWRDASTLAFTAPVVDADADDTDETIHVTIETDDKVRLFQVAAAGGKVVPLTHNNDQITSFWLSPDGGKALTVQTRDFGGGDEYYQKIPQVPRLNYLVDLSNGTEKSVLQDVRSVSGVTWSSDSQTAWVESNYTPDKLLAATTTKIRALDVPSGSDSEVDLDWSRGIHSQTGATPSVASTSDGFMAMLADGTNPRLAAYSGPKQSPARQALEGEHQGSIFAFDVSKDGKKIVYLYSTPSTPPQMYAAKIISGNISDPRRFTDLNAGWSGKEFVRSEVISWQGAQNDPVDGILWYPSGYEPGKKYPLVLMIHGGPFHVDLAEWASNTYSLYPYQLMAQKGAFVLAPNYHGSSEYGLDFARSIRDGRFYDYPLQDIENAIDRLVELGMVDDNRLGTLGWSNGSILSNALIAQDQRFKAASLGAGGNEWVSLWGSAVDGYLLLEYYFGAGPIENPSLYTDAAMAPFYSARDVETPAVMYQGDADISVPPGMTWSAFRALQKYGKAPVELFIFPGAGHDPIQRSYQARKLTEDIKWFDKYLFDSNGP
ncbi:MAG: prolyl oligopeptidase family serine peptidase [Candidatus Nanopelagicales bacterium]|nr:prolyl oligopeptidase family serine peptidase [Candidatus Nanopelagicales bacterium]